MHYPPTDSVTVVNPSMQAMVEQIISQIEGAAAEIISARDRLFGAQPESAPSAPQAQPPSNLLDAINLALMKSHRLAERARELNEKV